MALLADVPVRAGGPDVIRKEAWSFYRTSSGVRLCWELEEPKGPKGDRPPCAACACQKFPPPALSSVCDGVSPSRSRAPQMWGTHRRAVPRGGGGCSCSPPPSHPHRLSTEQFPVSAYVGCSKNLKDLKTRHRHFSLPPPGQFPPFFSKLVRSRGWSSRSKVDIDPLDPLGPLGFEGAQHRQTLRPSVILPEVNYFLF